jgi:hypothetical protein
VPQDSSLRRRLFGASVAGSAFLGVVAAWFWYMFAFAVGTGQVHVFRSRGPGVASIERLSDSTGFWVFVALWSVGAALATYAAIRLARVARFLSRSSA